MDEPLFAHAVWIEQGARLGSGVLIHSSPERGTYVLTAAHVIMEDGYLDREHEIRVGVFDLSHVDELGEDYARYEATVVAATLAERPEGDELNQLLGAMQGGLDLLTHKDLAILRLDSERSFRAATLYTGDPAELDRTAAVAIPVVPLMYPHRKEATCSEDVVSCPDGVNGNSGSPIYVDGRVAGVYTFGAAGYGGPGPATLQAFVREREPLRFLIPGK